MKTKTKIDFTALKPDMLSVHDAERGLIGKLTALRAAHPSISDADFRAEWIAFGEALGYTTRWLGDIARDAGIRLRASGAGRKAKSDEQKAEEAFAKWLASMPEEMTKKQVALAIAALAKR